MHAASSMRAHVHMHTHTVTSTSGTYMYACTGTCVYECTHTHRQTHTHTKKKNGVGRWLEGELCSLEHILKQWTLWYYRSVHYSICGAPETIYKIKDAPFCGFPRSQSHPQHLQALLRTTGYQPSLQYSSPLLQNINQHPSNDTLTSIS